MKNQNKFSINLKIFIYPLLTLLFFQACKSDGNKQEDKEEEVAVKLLSPDFNPDSALAFTKAQVDFGPRIPSTDAHANTLKYLVAKFKSYGGTVTVQEAPAKTYDGKTHRLKNIIAAFSPEKTQRVLISAHWDARPFSDQDPDEKMRDKPFEA
ncbi:MAG: glutamine cyclotransferase, partial [Pedobacter sp.]